MNLERVFMYEYYILFILGCKDIFIFYLCIIYYGYYFIGLWIDWICDLCCIIFFYLDDDMNCNYFKFFLVCGMFCGG